MSMLGGNLEKLKIVGYKDPELRIPIGLKGSSNFSGPGVFVATINPASISLSFTTSLIEKKGDSLTPPVTYMGGNPPTLSFDLVLDGTGALGNLVTSNPLGVSAQIEMFKKACYYYVPDKHDIPYVRIQWGAALASYKNATFAGRLDSLKINITLFSPLGLPLRAILSASFLGTVDGLTATQLQNKNSPDLTHLVTIKAGDSLPMLCKDIYDNPQMYHQIAKINKLTNFRKLIPGQQLEFPPIKQI